MHSRLGKRVSAKAKETAARMPQHYRELHMTFVAAVTACWPLSAQLRAGRFRKPIHE